MKVNKIELFALLNQADDELLQIIYALLLKVNDVTEKPTSSTYNHDVFLERLKEVQKTKPFSNIKDSTEWQKQIRNEWE